MIRHILKDGSCVESIAGMTIKADQFDALYRMMEKVGGDKNDKPVSASEKSSARNRRKKQSSFLS